MTIKLSTTNSVNKTLQHKALWGLGGHRIGTWLQLRGRVGSSDSEALDSRRGTTVPLREIHRILYQFVRSTTWGVENAAICPPL